MTYWFPSISWELLKPGDHQQLARDFQAFIFDYAQKESRSFPWRETKDPYRILLSELMLQQTQTIRVLPKYEDFLNTWPDFSSLAGAGTSEIIIKWRGLGYNRRALALHEIAKRTEHYGWTLPPDYSKLLTFPMIGPATAAAICAFSYELPAVYLETNIRRVLLHQFFPEEENVSDKRLRPILEALVQNVNAKAWYYALMDYGVYLAKNLPNPNRRSAHYTKQSRFADSNRQIRGLLLLLFAELGTLTEEKAIEQLPKFETERVRSCFHALAHEGFIVCEDEHIYRLKN